MKNVYIIAAVIIVLALIGAWYFAHPHTAMAPTVNNASVVATSTNETPQSTNTGLGTPSGTVTTTTVTTVTTGSSTPPNEAAPGAHCGGNMTTAKGCTTGYHCAPEPGSHLPFGDVGGICIAN